MITPAKIQSVVDKIAREFKPEKIILFGSYAWGKPTEDSDVDKVIIKDVEDTEELERKVSMALFPRPFPIDVLVYSPKSFYEKIHEDRNLFLEDVAINGIPLFTNYGNH